MTSNRPMAAAAPTPLRKLNRAALAGLCVAAAIVVAFVLPAEYGIDPTGVGRVLGLTRMGETKAAQAGASRAPEGPVAGDSVSIESDGGRRVRMVLGPYAGREAKAVMRAGDEMRYEWSTDGKAVEFEFHGDPDAPKFPGEYASYEKGEKAGASGTFKAGFAGHHGWYWKNLSATPVVVTATVEGAIEEFAPIYGAGGAATATLPAAPVAGASVYYTDLPMKRFMADVMSRTAGEIWKRQGYISDEKGLRSLFPANDAEWKEAEGASLTLAEISNSLLLPGRRVPEPEWDAGAANVRKGALKLAEATRQKNEDAFTEAGGELVEACSACHQRYAPGASLQ